MYVEDWDAFSSQAVALFRSRPLHTRYTLKFRHCDGKLVLKVTDDVVCLKYTTDQQADMKRIEALNNTFFRLMARGPRDAGEEVDAAVETAAAPPAAAAASPGRKPRRRG